MYDDRMVESDSSRTTPGGRGLSRAAVVAVLSLLLVVTAGSVVSVAAAAAPTGGEQVREAAPRKTKKKPRVKIVIRAPKSVSATVTLKGKPLRVVAKGQGAKKIKKTLKVKAGRHKLQAEPLVSQGAIYRPVYRKKAFKLRPGATRRLVVKYVAVKGAPQALELSSLTSDSVGLIWSGGAKAKKIQLRRTEGTVPAAAPTKGVPVAANGNTAVDDSVEPGRNYTYALFARVAGVWMGPLTVAAGTPADPWSEPTEAAATYVAAEGTLLPARQGIKVVARRAKSLTVRLPGELPRIGQVLVLPVTPALTSGYVGRVVSLTPTGGIVLQPAGLAEAFDYLEYSIPEFDTGPIDATLRAPQPARVGESGARARAVKLPSCLSGSFSETVTFTPRFWLQGSAAGRIVKKKLRFFPDIPVGAELEGYFEVGVSAAASVEASMSIACGLDIAPIAKTFMAGPVPMALVFDSTVEVSVSGSLSVSNLGYQAKAGARWDAGFGAGVDDRVNADRIFAAEALTPVVKAEGALGLTLGGGLTFGPGAVEKDAGAVAGLRGQLNLLEASAAVIKAREANDPRGDMCAKLSAGGSAGLSLTARAWLGRWSAAKSYELSGMNGDWSYGGPWHKPFNCESGLSDNVFIVTTDEEDSSTVTVAAALTALGYTVETGSAMPPFPGDYGQIWVFGVYTGHGVEIEDKVAQYIAGGGSVFMNAEHLCCFDLNESVERVMDTVLSANVDIVTDCTDPCLTEAFALNPGAIGNIANTPNVNVSVFTDALGYATGVPAANRLLMVGSYVSGTVWGPGDMAGGKGRLVTLHDSNWSNASNFTAGNAAFVENVAHFLRG